MAVIDQVSQFLPYQSVYRSKGFLEVCAERDIGDDDRDRV